MNKALQIQHNTICPELIPLQREIIKATDSPQLRSMNKDDVRQVVKELITITLEQAGEHKKDLNELKVLVEGVTNDAIREYDYYTTQELAICFREGLREKYGDNYGISVKTCYMWMNGFRAERMGSISKQRTYQKDLENKKHEQVDKERAELYTRSLKMRIRSAYKHYCDKRTYEHDKYGSPMYDHLHGLGLINDTEEEFDAMRVEVIQHHEAHTTATVEDTEDMTAIERSALAQTVPQELTDTAIETLTRRRSVFKYFERLRLAGTDIATSIPLKDVS